ncbi:hypothetical protein BFAG_00244 [Bacteroides fragilis 3_1_12]|uniref:Uncharacterized protein n=1 Tax=Bacteroides fragilis 3_1_12 TaxID=457424 RepID=A0ABN0BF39_BACFG|nr:hypothetical protein BFAG_00244 [Bacteroides fragilis 3_1_12]
MNKVGNNPQQGIFPTLFIHIICSAVTLSPSRSHLPHSFLKPCSKVLQIQNDIIPFKVLKN